MYRKFIVGQAKTTTLLRRSQAKREARMCISREATTKEKKINQPKAEKELWLNKNV